MFLRNFTLTYGVAFLLVGICGFIPGITQMHHGDPNLVVNGPGTGMLLGLFHVNLVHNLVHILFGIWGLVAFRSTSSALLYARVVAVAYLVLAVCGLVPGLNNLFGFCPLGGPAGPPSRSSRQIS